MNYDDPDTIDALAREYVLGTLDGRARRRFEGLLRSQPTVQAAVSEWDARLAPMNQEHEPVQPPASVWTAIQRRISQDVGAPVPWWRAVGLWQGMAAALAVLSIVLGLVLLQRPPVPELPTYVAVVVDAQNQPVWSVHLSPTDAQVYVQPINPAQRAADQDFELWLLPADGAAPISLGLLPMDESRTLRLSAPAVQAAPTAPAVAVSLEPAGGSQTGAPTGPVLFSAPLVRT